MRRQPVIIAASIVAVLGIGGAAVAVLSAVRHQTLGEAVAQLQGHIVVDHYASAADVPTADRPEWMPRDARDITVKRPGADQGEDADAIKVDFLPGEGHGAPRLPAFCAAGTSYSQPFDGGGYWSPAVLERSHGCGTWRISTDDGRVFAWRG